MPRPNKYTQISMDTKQKLIEAVNRGEAMKNACLTLQIPVRSGQRIYQKYRENGELVPNEQRGGYKPLMKGEAG